MGGCPDADALVVLDLEESGFEVFLNRPIAVQIGTHWYDYNLAAWAARPELPDVSASYDLTALPTGSVVTVVDESGTEHEVTDLSETLTLEGPQTYVVTVEPPFPYRTIRTRLEVA